MIYPKELATGMSQDSLKMMDIYQKIRGNLQHASTLLDVISTPCESYLEYRNEIEKSLLEVGSLVSGEFPNYASTIGKQFKDAFEGIATTRDYPEYDPEALDKKVIMCDSIGTDPFFSPARFVAMHGEKRGHYIQMDEVEGCLHPGGQEVSEVGYLLQNTIGFYDVLCANRGEGVYEKVLDPIPGLLGELDKAKEIIHKVIEWVMCSELAAFHATATDEYAIRDRVSKCNVIYGMNLSHLSEVCADINQECAIRAYCMKHIVRTSEVIDLAWKKYLEEVKGTKF